MLKNTLVSPFSFFAVFFTLASATFLSVEAFSHLHTEGQLVPKHDRKLLSRTEYGEISAVMVTDGTKGPYHLQFITLEPNSVFLPVFLHADMVFFVHTGSGTLSWTDDDNIRNVNIRKGDIYSLPQGSVFYVQSSLEAERRKLRIYAIFTDTEDDLYDPSIGAYSSITDMVLGFDSRVLQAAFKVPEEVIEEIMGASKAPPIIHAVKKEKMKWQDRLLKAFLESKRGGFFDSINGKHKKKTKAYNVFEEDPDFENCNGWSATVDRKDLKSLKHSNIGVFMVNLTKGSMMAPHWNPRASEISIVLQGEGMVRVICSSNAKESGCKNMRYRVEEGDVFAVPRFHPMAQMSFNNGSFVFMGFSTSTRRNHPQFLAGKGSTLGSLDRQILSLSFNVSNTTIDQLLTPQKESVILDCTSCAEEEERLMEEEIERKRKEEEEARKRREEEEEARKRREEEEEARKRKEEEEEARRRKEEEAKRKEEEEARKREEEAKRKEEEEARKREEEEEARKREEEEAQKRKEEEEEARKRREEEEEEARRKEEEEARKRREEEEEEARRKEEEEEKEEARRREEEKAQSRWEEEEEARRKEEEEARQREEEEEARQREEEAQHKREKEEEKARREEEARREQEEAQRQEEERQRRAEQEETEEARREKEEAQRQEEEETEEERQRKSEEETEEGGDEGRGQRSFPKNVWDVNLIHP